MEKDTEQAIENTLIHIATRLIRSVYATICIMVAVTAGATAWVTQVNSQLQVITDTIVKLESKMPPKWVADALVRVEVEQERLQFQIDRLEHNVGAYPKE